MRRRGVGFPHSALAKTPIECAVAARKRYGIAVDFTAFFHQFVLPTNLQLWYFRHDNIWYKARTIPTGASFCPAIAQLFSTGLSNAILGRFPLCVINVYIDNVRIAADDVEYVRAAVKYLYELCLKLDITINEDLQTVLRVVEHYDFLGITYNHIDHTTQHDEKLRNKLIALKTQIIPLSMSLRHFLHCYGLLNYGSAIARHARGRYYLATKFLRRHVGRPLDDEVAVWPSVTRLLLTWRDDVLSAAALHHTVLHDPRRATLFTDSSSTGFGAILFTDSGRTEVFAQRWGERTAARHINEKEALCVLKALQTLDLADVDELTIMIDNSSALFSLAKGDSRNHFISKVVTSVWSLECWEKVQHVEYVRSEDNRADLPSRLLPADRLQTNMTNPLTWATLKRQWELQVLH